MNVKALEDGEWGFKWNGVGWISDRARLEVASEGIV